MPRENERVTYFTEVVLEWASGKREARVSDLSIGGCYVETIATVPEGEKIDLELKTSAGGAIRLAGEVAYALPGFGFGVKFVGLTDEQTAFIRSAVEAR